MRHALDAHGFREARFVACGWRRCRTCGQRPLIMVKSAGVASTMGTNEGDEGGLGEDVGHAKKCDAPASRDLPGESCPAFMRASFMTSSFALRSCSPPSARSPTEPHLPISQTDPRRSQVETAQDVFPRPPHCPQQPKAGVGRPIRELPTNPLGVAAQSRRPSTPRVKVHLILTAFN